MSFRLYARDTLFVVVAIIVRKPKLTWYGHVIKKTEEVGIMEVLEWEVTGKVSRKQLRLGEWMPSEKDMVRMGL